MAAILIGGQEAGLLDTSLNLLDRNDRSSESNVGSDELLAVNVASGNLVLSRQDTYLPSLGDDFELVRTYNSRGQLTDTTRKPEWRVTQEIKVTVKRDAVTGATYYEVKYGDGSLFSYYRDATTGLYESTDGAGAFETLRLLDGRDPDRARYEVTRGDQTVLRFDSAGNVVNWTDPNGVSMTYTYRSGRLARVLDDTENAFFFNYDRSGRLISVVDGNRTTLVEYTYDRRTGVLSSVKDRNGDITKYFYDRDGYLTRMELPRTFGEELRAISFEYTRVSVVFPDQGRASTKVLTKLTDAMGQVTTFNYAFDLGPGSVYRGGTTTVTDASGAKLSYSYDARGYITSVTDRGQAHATSYEYDADGNLTKVTDRNGEESFFTYDDRGNLLTSTDSSGNTTTYTYTSFNKLETVEAPEGGLTVLEYDAKQNLIRQTDPGGDVTEFEYDALGNLTRQIVYLDATDRVDPAKQQITTYRYDAFGNQVQIIDPEGGITRSTFDAYGNRTRLVDANNHVYLYTYDGDNRLLTAQDPQGEVERSVYDSVGNRLSFKDGNGRLTVYVYDRNNRLISTTVSGHGDTPRTTTRSYDVVGNGTEVTDGEGNTTRYVYNARREVLEVITPQVVDRDGAPVTYRTSYTYDGEGQVLTINDNNGNVTTYTYTPVGLVETETNARGLLTEYYYDGNLNVLQIASGLAATAQNPKEISRRVYFTYDAEDQLETITDAEGNVTRYDYDAPGNVISVIDGEENETRYEYDLNNRLVRETLPADDQGIEHTIVRSYDANGNEVSVTNENGQTRHLGYDELNRRIRLTDENGITTEFEYDRADNLTRVIIGGEDNDEAQITTFLYNVFDELVGEIDAVGNALIHSNAELYQNMRTALNSRRNVEQLTVQEREGLLDLFTTRYTYDRAGNRTSYTDSEGRVTAFEYDDMNRLVLQTDALGGTRSFRYDGNGNLQWQEDENGNITTWSFDEADQVTRTQNAEGGVLSYGYDIFGNIVRQEESGNTVLGDTETSDQALGMVSTYVYDKNNLLLTETNINPVGANRTTVYKYDKVGNRTEVIDARGKKTEYEYDARNRNVKIIDPLLQEAVFEYDGVGNQIRILDPRGNASAFAYDPGNRLISFTDAEGRRTEYEYDVRGNQIRITTGVDGLFDPATQDASEDRSDRQTTVFEYDAENNLRAVTDATGATTSFDFDRVYNEVSETDARGNRTRREFDALNRQVKVTDALGNMTTFAYDALGNNLSITDARGFTTEFEYDGNSNLIIERDALGTETHYENDGFGNRIAITQAAVSLELDEDTGEPLTKPRKTTFYYDSFGNLVREVNAFDDEKTYRYDANNNVTESVDELGRTTTYEYDDNNQLTDITSFVESSGNPSTLIPVTTSFGYDKNGNRNLIRDPNNGIARSYFNANDEVILVVDPLGFATGYQYDTNGNVVEAIRFKNPVVPSADLNEVPEPVASRDDQVTRFEYDALNRLVKTIDPMLGESVTTYDAVGNVVAFEDPNGNITNYVYDALNRQAQVVDPLRTGQTEAERGRRLFTYDARGNLSAETDQRGNTTRYEYDALDRLVKITDPLDGMAVFTYDAVGNQLTETDQRGNTLSFEYDLLDRLTKRTDSELDENNEPGIATWTYDKVGNRLTFTDEEGATREYIYDALNRVIQEYDPLGGYVKFKLDAEGREVERRKGTRTAGDDGHATQFAYDSLGRLISRTDAEDGGRSFTYDAFGNLVAESDENGLVTRFEYDRNNRLVTLIDPRSTDAAPIEVRYGYDAAGNRVTETDERGHTTTFIFDALNRLEAQRDPVGKTRSFTFDAVGNVVVERDENGNEAFAVFDANNRLVEFLSASGYYSTYAYDEAGNEVERREYTGVYSSLSGPSVPRPDDTPRITRSTYNTRNQLLTSTDATGLTTFYEYDKTGRLVKTRQGELPAAAVVFSATGPSATTLVLTEGAGTSEVQFDANGRVIREIDANGIATSYVLDDEGNVLRKTEAEGEADQRITDFVYDNLGRLKSETRGVGTDDGTTIAYEYDAADRLIARRTAGDSTIAVRVERFEYDDSGRLSAEINGVGLRTEYFYDAAGNQIRVEFDVTTPGTSGRFNNRFEYDENNRLILEIDGEGVKTRYEYDANGNKTKTIQAYQHGVEPERVTLYTYDAENRLIAITNPELQTTQYRYDVDGNRSEIIDAKGMVTRNTFDAMGRILTNTVDAGGQNGGVRTSNVYDSRGNLLSSSVGFVDGSDTPRVTHYAYDKLDQLIRITDPEGFATLFTYDNFGNQTSVILGVYEGEPGGGVDQAKADRARPQASYFFYDGVGRLERTIDGEGNAVVLEYDAHGNQVSQQTGVKISQAEASSLNLPFLVASDDQEQTSRTQFRYDLNGELTRKESEAGGVVETLRDKLGRQIEVRTLQSGTGSAPTTDKWVVESFEYDSMGRVTVLRDSYGAETRFTYDALGNNTTVSSAAGDETAQGRIATETRTTRSTYDKNSNILTFEDAEGGITRYFYDSVGNLERTINPNGAESLSYFDARNQLIGTVGAEGAYVRYERDALGNIVKETAYATLVTGAVAGTLPTVPAASIDDRMIEQRFDGNGQRISETLPNGFSRTYVYDSAGLLLIQTDDISGLRDAGALARTRDKTLRENLWTYDAAGRLTSFTNPAGVVETYTYDSAGNRIREELIPTTGTDLLANGLADVPRVTVFTYDKSNRQLSQTIGGSTQRLEYDAAGNVIARLDALDNRVESTYDLNNRIETVTENLDETITYRYDAVGNLIETVDAKGAIFNLAYDRNNRLTTETGPLMDFYSVEPSPDPSLNGLKVPTSRPGARGVATQEFDRAGNGVRLVNESGFITSRWFDGSNRLIAEVDGNNVLTRYEYNAFGEVIEVVVDRKFVEDRPDALSEPPPAIPGDQAIRTSNRYDVMGNLVRIINPEITVTTINGSGTGIASSQDLRPEEQRLVDAFGRLVQSVDRNGESEYSFFDRSGYVIATVDKDGFLVQSEYDVAGQLVQQRQYASPLTSVAPETLPTGAGGFDVVDREYDVQGRLVREISAAVRTDASSTTRVITAFAYDAAGNMKQRTLASGTNQAQTEYYYYDAVGRRTAVVDARGVLAVFAYDKNGNLTEQTRFITPLTQSASELAADGTTAESLAASVVKNPAEDQTNLYVYNPANLVATQTNVMHNADNIVTQFFYDESGNMTWRVDPDGYTSFIDHDAKGSVILTIAPNGSRTFSEFNTQGLKTRSWVGGVQARDASPVTEINVEPGSASATSLEFSWLPPASNALSWIAWDTRSRAAEESQYGNGNVPSQNPNIPPAQGLPENSNGNYRFATSAGNISYAGAPDRQGTTIPLETLVPGQTVYFRVVTEVDANLSWSQEQAVYIPPRIDALSVEEKANGDFTVRVGFNAVDALIANPTLRDGSGAVLANLTLNNGVYEGTIAGGTNPQGLDLRIGWSSGGNNYQTDALRLLAAPGEHSQDDNNPLFFSWPLPNAGAAPIGGPNADELLIINGVSELERGTDFPNDGVVFPSEVDTQRRVDQTLQFRAPETGPVNYDVYYGTATTDIHSLDIAFTDKQNFVTEVVRTNTNMDGDVVSRVYSRRYVSDGNGDVGVAISVDLSAEEAARVSGSEMKVAFRLQGDDGRFTGEQPLSRSGNTWSTDSTFELDAGTTHDLKIFYFDADGNEVIVNWRRIETPGEVAPDDLGSVTVDDGDPVPTGPDGPSRDKAVGTPYDYDDQTSFTVVAAERGGEIRDVGGERVVSVGTYSGPRDVAPLTFDYGDPETDGNVGFLAADYENIYFTEIRYNDLGDEVASNENTGLWRIFGVDAAGNKVVTGLYGTREAAEADSSPFASSRNSFARFDGRGNEIETIGVAVTGQTQRAVATTEFDYAGRVVSRREPGAGVTREYRYDGVGNLIREWDRLNASSDTAPPFANDVQYVYDLLGNRVSASRQHSGTAVYHTEYFEYGYTGLNANRLLSNYFGTPGSRVAEVRYTYDSFGRRLTKSNGDFDGNSSTGDNSGGTITVVYDQRGRITQLTDALGRATLYYYDKRGNQTWVRDAQGNVFGAAFDGMGLLTNQYSFLASPGSAAFAQRVVDNAPGDSAAAAFRPFLVETRTVYDIWTNKREVIDPLGRRQTFRFAGFGRVTSVDDTAFTYDQWGNQTREYDNWGKDIRRSYDEAGRLKTVDDLSVDFYPASLFFFGTQSTRRFTEYDYDVAGNRTAERLWLTTKGTLAEAVRNKSYTYDAVGRLTSWNEARSGVGASYTYFADGNINVIQQNGQGASFYRFDVAGRVLDAGNESFTYDSAGNRVQSRIAGSLTTDYVYNANGWVTRATTTTGEQSTWLYDQIGNVTRVETRFAPTVADGNTTVETKSSTYTYDARYLTVQTRATSITAVTNAKNETTSSSTNQLTTTNFDRSGRTISTQVVDTDAEGEVKTVNYVYSYFFFGPNKDLQWLVTGSGEDVVTGSSVSTYDHVGNLVSVNLGKGDQQERDEVNRFVYDNDRKIITAIRDSGIKDEAAVTTQYLYANGNPVGQYEEGKAGEAQVNQGPYSTVRTISTGLAEGASAFPDSSVIQHRVEAGETLQSLAKRYYGSPDLWYVIADANGLTGKEELKVGSRLVVPNTTANAYQNSETNTLYREGDIIGSQLPNLASPPPPPKDFCAIIAAIILTIIVAIASVVLTIVTVGIAAPAAGAALTASGTVVGGLIASAAGAITSTIIGAAVATAIITAVVSTTIALAVGAVLGAAIAFAASALTQGILLAFGLQEEFDWEAVAGDVVAGAFGGAAAGLGAVVSAASKATALVKAVNIIGQTVLESAGEAAAQAVSNDGKIDNPWLIAAAGAGGAFGAVADFGSRTAKSLADLNIDATTKAARKAQGRAVGVAADVAKPTRDAAAVGSKLKVIDTKVFASVYKAEYARITRPISTAVSQGKKLVSAGASLVSAPFKALRAGGDAKVAIKQAVRQVADAVSDIRIAKNLDDVKRAGTIQKDDFFKTVRSFDVVDGQQVTKYKQVIRKSARIAGKTDKTKFVRGLDSITQLPDGTRKVSYSLTEVERLSVATPSKFKRFLNASGAKFVDSVAKPIGNLVKKPFVAIREFKLTRGSVAKLETTKIKRSFDTIDGKRVEKLTEVVRNSRKTSIKSATKKVVRVIDTDPPIPGRLGQTKLQVVARKNPAGTTALQRFLVKPLRSAGESAKTAIIARAKDGRLEQFIGNKGQAVAEKLPGLLGEERKEGVRGTKMGQYRGILSSLAANSGELTTGPVFDLAKSMLKSEIKGKIARGPLIVAPDWVNTAVNQVGGAFGLPAIPPFVLGQASKTPAKGTPTARLNDRNARITYADLHARQHNWLPVDWVKVAANSSSQVFSPFAIDRSASLETVLNSNRMVSGQVANFSAEDVVAFSERSVGGVGGDVSRMPNSV